MSSKPNNKRGSKPNKNQREKGGKPTNPKSKKFEDIKGNDIAWWNKSSLYPLATNVPYNKMPGYIYDQGSFADKSYDVYGGAFASFPSVMQIEYIPTLGIARDANSPVNLCFNSLFAELVAHYNNSNIGFQQMDLALLTLSITSVITQIAEAERALGLTNMYFRENAAFPRGIVTALNVDFDDLVKRKAEYTLRLQNIVQNFNALRIPSYIDLFKRCMQLGRNVYMDEDNIMSQAFVFVSRGVYTYIDTEMKLEYSEYEEEFMNMDERLNVLYSCVEALRNTSDLGNIMGVLRKAFPETATIQLDIPTTMDITAPYYDRNVAWQINNLMIAPGRVVNLDIYQDPVQNVLVSRPMIATTLTNDEEFYRRTPGYSEELLVNSYNGEIGPEFIMEATRLMFTMDREPGEYTDDAGNVNTAFELMSCGTEIVSKVLVFNAVKSEIDGLILWHAERISPIQNLYDLGTNVGSVVTAGQQFMKELVALTKFRNHPRVLCVQSDAETVEEAVSYGFIGDLNVYTSISPEQLEYINLAALQSVYLITVTGERSI